MEVIADALVYNNGHIQETRTQQITEMIILYVKSTGSCFVILICYLRIKFSMT